MILHGEELSQPATIFARSFEELDETDQTEILNLIRFKQQMKEQIMSFAAVASKYKDPEKMAADYLAEHFRNKKIEYPIDPFIFYRMKDII